MTTRTKQPHYVPRFYLEGFADAEGFVHAFDLEARKAYSAKPDKIATEGGIYDARFEVNGREMSGEEFFGAIEVAARPIRDKLIAGEALSEDERSNFAWFLASGTNRTPAGLERQAEIEEQFLTALIAFNPAAALAHEPEPGSKDALLRTAARGAVEGKFRIRPAKSLVLDAMLASMQAVVGIIEMKSWAVMKIPVGRSIATCDAPLIFFSSPNYEPGFLGPSPMDEKAGWLFPLDRHRFILLRGNDRALFHGEIPGAAVEKMNSCVAENARRLIIGGSREFVEELGRKTFEERQASIPKGTA